MARQSSLTTVLAGLFLWLRRYNIAIKQKAGGVAWRRRDGAQSSVPFLYMIPSATPKDAGSMLMPPISILSSSSDAARTSRVRWLESRSNSKRGRRP